MADSQGAWQGAVTAAGSAAGAPPTAAAGASAGWRDDATGQQRSDRRRRDRQGAATTAAGSAAGAPSTSSPAAAGAFSGSFRPDLQAPTGGEPHIGHHTAIQKLLLEAKESHISWHLVLNNHFSQRPKEHGGALCKSVRACKEYDIKDGQYCCRIRLPNSYWPDDAKRIEVEGLHPDDKAKAGDAAGCAAFTILCSNKDGLPRVLLRPKHWKVPIADLVADIGRILDPAVTFQHLPVHERRATASGATVPHGGLKDVPENQKERAAELIRLTLWAHGGSFDPAKIDHKKIVAVSGRQPGAVYHQLGQLLPKGTLKQFIEQHAEFDIDEQEGARCWNVKWRSAASAALPAASSSAAASGAPSPSVSHRSGQTFDNNGSTATAFRWRPSTWTAAASGAPSNVQDASEAEPRVFPDEGDRAHLSKFWRIGPGRAWKYSHPGPAAS